ncbi:uracil-xanthine permease family protein [Nocardioides sp. L-11A]|uniref:uracil-xanthine permease family protein n=1 Tax=Nocardioides sp. L-11A TaxID=3043848 RepID=UPI00249AEC82|nr:solute carrier family 23 protein [Nocardioides sp. L-11A]
MMRWQLHGDGKTIRPGEVVRPDERLSAGRMLGISVQHVLTMFGGTVLFPLLIGLPFGTAVFMSGVGTLLFFAVVRGRIPSYLGSSAAIIGPAFAIYGQGGSVAEVTGAMLVTGVVLMGVGALVHAVGARTLHTWLPPLVTGTVVMLIALNIAPILGDFWTKDQTMAIVTLIVVVVLSWRLQGFLSRLAVLLTIVIGYALSWAADGIWGPLSGTVDGETVSYDRVDWSKVGDAAWFALPDFAAPSFSWSAIVVVLPIVVVLLAENIGHVKAVAEMTGTDLDSSMGRAIIGDGAATALSAAVGGSATTTYAENIGVMAASRVYSSLAYVLAGVMAMALGCSPKLGAVIYAIPGGVIGGILVYLVGLIAVIGARTWIDNGVDLHEPKNYIPAAVGLCLGTGSLGLVYGDFFLGGVALGTFLTIVLHRLIARTSGPVAPSTDAEGAAA